MEKCAVENAISDNVKTPSFKNFPDQSKVLMYPCLHAIRFGQS